MNGQDFTAMLERAIERSGKAKAVAAIETEV
jgi:ABC-type phosphate transport system auxiliary subunit